MEQLETFDTQIKSQSQRDTSFFSQEGGDCHRGNKDVSAGPSDRQQWGDWSSSRTEDVPVHPGSSGGTKTLQMLAEDDGDGFHLGYSTYAVI